MISAMRYLLFKGWGMQWREIGKKLCNGHWIFIRCKFIIATFPSHPVQNNVKSQ